MFETIKKIFKKKPKVEKEERATNRINVKAAPEAFFIYIFESSLNINFPDSRINQWIKKVYQKVN